ncbi:hypothetical protein PIB30_040387 [Stylosanthes scabra]|uniref:Uncharacterized protein n=1 Tax=Stylosanthes scabra TaxID=79078 RepID=A0ABU6ZD93_9FABA|nr:hypothetical protein [Stylosanthes scabra]
MEDLLSLAIKVEKQQQLLAAWLSSDSIFKSSSEEATFEDKTKSKVADLKKHHKKKKSSSATFHSSSSPVMEEFVEYAVSGDVYVDDEPLVQQSSKEFMGWILNKRHAQSTELLESFPSIEQDSRTNLFEEEENDTCSRGHFRHFSHKGQNGNLVMFEDQNTRRITLYRFWTSRRPRVRIKRKCIDLEHKEHGFHQVTWSASNHKKRAKLIGFSSDSEIT